MPALSNGAPIFAVTDLPKAVDFYTHKLGFKVSMQSSIPFPYAIVNRDGIDVHLMIDDSRRGKGAMYAITDDVDALYEELKAHRGAARGSGVRDAGPVLQRLLRQHDRVRRAAEEGLGTAFSPHRWARSRGLQPSLRLGTRAEALGYG